MGRNLIRHWEQINGCASSASHMNPNTLQGMTDTIGWVLRDHEVTIDAMSRSLQSYTGPRSATPTGDPGSSGTLSGVTSGAWEENDTPSPVTVWNTPGTFVGNLELGPDEANIVIQEALSNSVYRLAVMLQDIEEEVASLRDPSDGGYRLRTKDLTTRLFRLLGRVTSLETVQ
jgi:hypothetical protein